MTELKPGVIGYLIIEDVLGKAPLIVHGIMVDAIVDVTVVQDGLGLVIEDITIDDDILDMEHPDGTLEYRLTDKVDDDFLTQVYAEISRIAMERARNTSEDFWEYRAE